MSLKESREGDLPRGGKDLILARGMCSDAMSPQWGPMLLTSCNHCSQEAPRMFPRSAQGLVSMSCSRDPGSGLAGPRRVRNFF